MTIDLRSIEKDYENEDCGGYHDEIYDETREDWVNLVDAVRDEVERGGGTNLVYEDGGGFNSPGYDVNVLAIAYLDGKGIVQLHTYEITNC